MPQSSEKTTATPIVAPSQVKPLPEPIATAASRARQASRLLCIDFHAEWSAPCRVLEERVLSAREVREVLRAFDFLKVDTDEFPQAAKRFGVVGLPTLVVLDPAGHVLFRHLGPIDVDGLVRALKDLHRR